LIEILVQEESRVAGVVNNEIYTGVIREQLNFSIDLIYDIIYRAWHKGLIYTLKQSGSSGNLLKRFQKYLHGREQRVVTNDSNSNYFSIDLIYDIIYKKINKRETSMEP
jgi:hypothetical protein